MRNVMRNIKRNLMRNAMRNLMRRCRYLEVSRALDGEHQDDGAVLQEGLGELGLVAGRGGPDAFLLGDVDVPHVAALHDEVAHGGEEQLGRRRWLCGLQEEEQKQRG
ncbi:hypothetical protein EYF80_061311 [Liparis tanakae]|uniref:Uncharacterized protein n=1 Tax=Liparis tanakae TaxID=230148 RepID=A0A4Z2EIU3_9TELE|nr:hypothetical protein EYF80_061311 [Liparis tanakae]